MRSDYRIILDLIPENSKVIDIGCSDGELISLLADKNISAQGVELNQEKVISCLEKGLLVVNTGRESIKLGPPLSISEEALLEGLDVLEESITENLP